MSPRCVTVLLICLGASAQIVSRSELRKERREEEEKKANETLPGLEETLQKARKSILASMGEMEDAQNQLRSMKNSTNVKNLEREWLKKGHDAVEGRRQKFRADFEAAEQRSVKANDQLHMVDNQIAKLDASSPDMEPLRARAKEARDAIDQEQQAMMDAIDAVRGLDKEERHIVYDQYKKQGFTARLNLKRLRNQVKEEVRAMRRAGLRLKKEQHRAGYPEHVFETTEEHNEHEWEGLGDHSEDMADRVSDSIEEAHEGMENSFERRMDDLGDAQSKVVDELRTRAHAASTSSNHAKETSRRPKVAITEEEHLVDRVEKEAAKSQEKVSERDVSLAVSVSATSPLEAAAALVAGLAVLFLVHRRQHRRVDDSEGLTHLLA